MRKPRYALESETRSRIILCPPTEIQRLEFKLPVEERGRERAQPLSPPSKVPFSRTRDWEKTSRPEKVASVGSPHRKAAQAGKGGREEEEGEPTERETKDRG